MGRKGGAKGAKSAPADPELQFRQEVLSSLPEAAFKRAQPRLAGVWNVPVRAAEDLSAAPG
eukprot:2271153-Amphidinium_carterae.1